MMPAVRPARAEDLPALTRFMAAHNALPQERCLFLGESLREIQGDLEEHFEGEPAESFVLAERGGRIAGALGCAVDATTRRGWLAGPWVAGEPWEETAAAMFLALRERLGTGVVLFDTYVDAQAKRLLGFYAGRGFRGRKQAHVYLAAPPADPAPLVPGVDLAPGQEAAFLDLHTRAFPEAPDHGRDLLDRRAADARILAMADAEGLLGYAAGIEQSALGEGFVEYLAVEPRARGRGHGRTLLRQMLQWFFTERNLGQVALTVDDANAQARGLYESAGFRLHRTGIALRWPLCG